MFETLTMLQQGGWPMIPLAGCSIAAVAIIIERSIALRRNRIMDRRLLRLIEDYRGEAHAEHAIGVCERVDTPFARLLKVLLESRHLDHAQAVSTMNAAGRTQVARLEHGLTLLEIIAGISPLIGLLGTVLGMVTVFNAISAQGMGNPQVLSEGISQALVTTVAGLSVAIPALACHTWLTRRVDKLATEMQDRATAFITKLQSLAPGNRS